MYFNNFPTIIYDSVGDGYFKDVTNLLRRVGVRAKIKTNTMLFDTYDVKEGETPESIADKLYDDPDATHHYEITQDSGDTTKKIEVFNPIDSDAYNSATVITNFEYEQNQQDEIRKIRLLDPKYIDDFVEEYTELMKESII